MFRLTVKTQAFPLKPTLPLTKWEKTGSQLRRRGNTWRPPLAPKRRRRLALNNCSATSTIPLPVPSGFCQYFHYWFYLTNFSQKLTAQLTSIRGLLQKLEQIHGYLTKVVNGSIPPNHQVMYHLQDVLSLVPDLIPLTKARFCDTYFACPNVSHAF